jgi:hypothetical protein
MTANDCINTALRRINSIAPGENPTAAETAAGLETLNDMLEAWAIERLMVWAVQRQMFPLVVGQQSYQIGSGAADFNTPRPVRIDRMGIINLSNPSQPLELPLEYLTEAEWMAIPVKQILSSIPQRVWDDKGFPYRTLSFWCIPSAPVQTTIYSWTQIGNFNDLSTDYEFPTGYADALKWNLAYRMAAEFGGFMPPQVPEMAAEAKARIKSLNIPVIDLRVDDALVATGKRQYNWITDSPIGSR